MNGMKSLACSAATALVIGAGMIGSALAETQVEHATNLDGDPFCRGKTTLHVDGGPVPAGEKNFKIAVDGRGAAAIEVYVSGDGAIAESW